MGTTYNVTEYSSYDNRENVLAVGLSYSDLLNWLSDTSGDTYSRTLEALAADTLNSDVRAMLTDLDAQHGADHDAWDDDAWDDYNRRVFDIFTSDPAGNWNKYMPDQVTSPFGVKPRYEISED